MKKFVTLNEYIASLQKIAQTHGEDEVLSLGTVTGTIDGIQNPRSINLIANGKTQSFYVPSYAEGYLPQTDIRCITFRYWVKQFDEGSEFGINGGRVSKLTIKNENTGKEVVNYDRGWDIKPKTKTEQAALDWVLHDYN